MAQNDTVFLRHSRIALILFVAHAVLGAQDVLSYRISANTKASSGTAWRLLTVRRGVVVLGYGVNNEVKDHEVPCGDFLVGTSSGRRWIKEPQPPDYRTWKKVKAQTLEFKDSGGPRRISIVFTEEIDRDPLLQIKDACATQVAEEPNRLQLDREAAAKARAEQARMESERASREQLEREKKAEHEKEVERWVEQVIQRRVKDFPDLVFGVLRAAEAPDPFASIRGDFDLSGSDNRQWKTSFQLPDADRCGLIKTPSTTGNAAAAWTLACTFTAFYDDIGLVQASGDGYERMVKHLQRVLSLPYQPDERTTNVNQVFFADPARPRWRLYVTKISESRVGVAIVAVSSGASAPLGFPTASPFSAAPAVLPTEPTVREEIEKIRLGKHGAMPPAQRASTGATTSSDRTTMTVKNSTAYELSVFFDGPVSTKLTLSPGGSQDVELAAGGFHVAGRVAAPNVLPFYGEEAYAGSARYSMTFYIAP